MCVRSWIEVLQEFGVLLTYNFHTTFEELKNNLDNLIGEDKVIDCILHDNHGI